jgi:hypothetical protein
MTRWDQEQAGRKKANEITFDLLNRATYGNQLPP